MSKVQVQMCILVMFDKLQQNNYLTLAMLRKGLPGLSREVMDKGINALRRARILTLDSSDGRHVRLSQEERDAAIVEDGQLLVYAARRIEY
jgi:hypothetical protein